MNNEILKKLEGLHTIDTVKETLKIKRQSSLNLLSKLKKQGYVTTTGGGKKKRLYKISMKKQRKREQGMFDILNKYSPMKLNPWYDHQVHGRYTVEDALVDAIETKSFRAILASLRLFSHITNWKKLYKLAKEKDCWQQIGALHDVAKMNFRVRTIPKRYVKPSSKGWKQLTQLKERHNYPSIEKKWHVHIPFNNKDVVEIS